MTILSRQLNILEKSELESQEQHWGVLTEAVGCISSKKSPGDLITEDNSQHSWAYLAAGNLYLASTRCGEVYKYSLSKDPSCRKDGMLQDPLWPSKTTCGDDDVLSVPWPVSS